jgi:nicotinate-nucleotide adenylyltransferase
VAGPAAPAERLGIFGGTFDPVHVAHLVDACNARHQLGLDRVLVVVAGDPWQKQGRTVAPADARFDMVAAAIEGVDGLEASRLEIDRGGPTYTIDTVRALEAPGRDLFLIMGSDVAASIESWHRVDELRDSVTLAIIDREPDRFPDPPGWRVVRVITPRFELSSTDLRARIAAGEPVEFLLPLPAVRILQARRLYTRADADSTPSGPKSDSDDRGP